MHSNVDEIRNHDTVKKDCFKVSNSGRSLGGCTNDQIRAESQIPTFIPKERLVSSWIQCSFSFIGNGLSDEILMLPHRQRSCKPELTLEQRNAWV